LRERFRRRGQSGDGDDELRGDDFERGRLALQPFDYVLDAGDPLFVVVRLDHNSPSMMD